MISLATLAILIAILALPAAMLVAGSPISSAGISCSIDELFATMAREQIGALRIPGDSYFASRSVQLATLGARYGIATSSNIRQFV
jgi:hypothetical protein